MPSNLVYQFRSKSILSYYKGSPKTGRTIRSESKQRSIENLLKQETYSGLVTHGSQKRLTRAIENLIQIASWKFFKHNGKEYPFKVNFVTLTLYSFNRRVPGKEAHKTCLEPFLRWLRVSKGMTAYVWKAELQSKRQDCHQLHYHITTDVYIPYDELRLKWNELQQKAGYLDYYFEKYGHWNPNSTDVHATYNKKNLVGYLKKSIIRYSDKKKYQALRSKYLVRAEMAKADQNKETIEGKVWDCSLNLKVAFYEMEAYGNVTDKIAAACIAGEIVEKKFERCSVYELKRKDAFEFIPYPNRAFWDDRLRKMREFERLKPDIKVFSTS